MEPLERIFGALEDGSERILPISKMEVLCEYQPSAGGAPSFSFPQGPKAIHNRLKEIDTLINEGGKWNPESPHAERFAIVLHQCGHTKLACGLFNAIVGRSPRPECSPDCPSHIGAVKCNVLFVYETLRNGSYISEETADKPGVLGYEGVWRFALVCLALKDRPAELSYHRNQAESLLLELATRIPPRCPPIRLGDIRLNALTLLKEEFDGSQLGTTINANIKEAAECCY